MRRTVFISHSVKDARLDWPPGRLPTRVVRRRPSRDRDDLEHARSVRDQVIDMIEGELRARAWCDVRRLKLGDRWDDEIDGALGACHAAVVVLNEQALASEYVRYEVSVLVNRARRDPRFRLVAILLTPIRVRHLKKSGAAALKKLAGLQVIVEWERNPESTTRILAKVKEGLGDLRSESAADPEAKWKSIIEDLLCTQDLAERLWDRINDDEPGDLLLTKAQMARRIADHLFDKGLDLTMARALAEACRVGYPSRVELVDELTPLWVDPAIAREILCHSTNRDAVYLIELTLDRPELGRHCVERAVSRSQEIDIVELPPISQARPQIVRDEVGRFLADRFGLDRAHLPTAVVGAGRKRMARLPPPPPVAGVVRTLRPDRLDRDGPRFMLVPADLPAKARHQVLAMVTAHCPEVTAVVLVGGRRPDDHLPLGDPVRICRLTIERDRADKARMIYRQMCRIKHGNNAGPQVAGG